MRRNNMTQRGEIVNNIGYKITRAALDYVEKHEFADAMDAFEDGAEWMRETMIEKATQWLFENVYDYLNPEDQERVESEVDEYLKKMDV
jgi:single-stranded DNA-specific DHH superfamily exonuclease